MDTTNVRPRIRWAPIVAATVLMLATVALIWLAAVPLGTGVCPTIDPPPTNCLASYRAGSGLVATIIVVTIWAVLIATALLWRRAGRALITASLVLLALAPFVSYAAVSGSPGFTLSATTALPPSDSPTGQWGEIAERSAHLTIVDDDTVTGSDGCNAFGGTWVMTKGVVEFSEMYMTLMMCPPRDSDLRGPVASAIAKGDRIHLFDEGGGEVGVLPRAGAE